MILSFAYGAYYGGGLNQYYDNINEVVELAERIPSALENMTMEDVERAFSQLPGVVWEGIKAIPGMFGDLVDLTIDYLQTAAGPEEFWLMHDAGSVVFGSMSKYEAARRAGERFGLRVRLAVDYFLARGGKRAFSAFIRALPREMRVAAWNVYGRASAAMEKSNVSRKKALALTGEAKAGTTPLALPHRTYYFKADLANVHFAKHGKSIMDVMGYKSYNLAQYIDDANHIVRNGTWVPELNGFVRFIGGKGSAKFGFVGLERGGSSITSFHIKTAAELEKTAPSLGITR